MQNKRVRRDEYGYTQKEVAQILGISTQRVGQIEKRALAKLKAVIEEQNKGEQE